MHLRHCLSLLISATLLAGCAGTPDPSAPSGASADAAPRPPIARRVPHTVVSPQGNRVDPYFWLRDDTRSDPQVLAYLEAENAYTDAELEPLAPLQDALYEEMVARLKQDDSSVPVFEDGWWSYTRFEQGRDYPIHARRAGSMDAPEQVVLDVNALATGHAFYKADGLRVSPDGRLLAYAEDTIGRRQYVLRIREIDSGRDLGVAIANVSPSIAWTADSASLLYVERDPVTLRTAKVRRHVLGSDTPDDLLYEEADESFYMGVMETRSERWLCIFVSSTVSSEQRCADAADPREFRVLAARERDIEYQADHLDGRWVVLTNWRAPNFRIMQVADEEAFDGRDGWRDLVRHDEAVFINTVELFDSYLVLDERSDALRRLRVLPQDGEPFFVASDEPAYTMSLEDNPEPGSRQLRYGYTSLTTPDSVYQLDLDSGERTLLKREPVLGDFDPADYVTERLWAPARDGERIPVSLVRHRDTPVDGSGALYLGAYGSYGSSRDPRFSSTLLSLLDRGASYAIAHVRGGQELGRRWYDAGRLAHKQNTFRDFIDVTDFLVAEGHAAKGRVAAAGGSAGGLLIGAVANMAPDRYAVMFASVPFVDVVTTMLDSSIPLTTNEFDEWGNPAEQPWYEVMLAYSPYDNVRAQAYPALYVDTGLWDSQVQYFEPAKWVAKLRANKTDANPLLLRINMEAGHGGRSGRFQRYREIAEEYAFALDRLGLIR